MNNPPIPVPQDVLRQAMEVMNDLYRDAYSPVGTVTSLERHKSKQQAEQSIAQLSKILEGEHEPFASESFAAELYKVCTTVAMKSNDGEYMEKLNQRADMFKTLFSDRLFKDAVTEALKRTMENTNATP